MTKKIAAILIAILIISIFFSGCDTIRETFNANNQPSATPAEMDKETWLAAMRAKQVPQMDGIENKSVIDWEENYLIYAIYPIVTDQDEISADIGDFVQNKIGLFKNEVQEGQGKSEERAKPQLSITYKPYVLKDAIVSFKVTTDADTGITRTNGFISTFVYSTRSQGKLSLDDVFNGYMDYPGKISDLVRNKLEGNSVLKSHYDQKLFEAGTAPEKSNFSNFVVGDGQIVFYFNALQIAPADAGSFEVALSFDDLKDLLWPDILNPEAAEPVNAGSGEDLPSFLISGEGDMNAFSIDGIDPLNDKVVALTFDDGPNPSTTQKILDVLKQYGARATFFVLGDRAEEFPGILKQIYDNGNEIGNHSYDHKDFKKLSTEDMLDEVEKTNQIIFNAVGARPILVRPPYGNITENIASEIGRACILWTVDPEDWKYKDVDIDYNNVMDNVQDGDIVLMHDIYQASADAAVQIIKELTARGYKLVTVSQMIQIAQARGQEIGLIVRDLRPKTS
jgi:peptidoglycan/xylan/chitin deacetylase (PgdA/CDA1 family)